MDLFLVTSLAKRERIYILNSDCLSIDVLKVIARRDDLLLTDNYPIIIDKNVFFCQHRNTCIEVKTYSFGSGILCVCK